MTQHEEGEAQMTPWPKNENQRSLQNCVNCPQAASHAWAGGEGFTCLCVPTLNFTDPYMQAATRGWIGIVEDGPHQGLHPRYLFWITHPAVTIPVRTCLFPHPAPKCVPGIVKSSMDKSHSISRILHVLRTSKNTQ